MTWLLCVAAWLAAACGSTVAAGSKQLPVASGLDAQQAGDGLDFGESPVSDAGEPTTIAGAGTTVQGGPGEPGRAVPPATGGGPGARRNEPSAVGGEAGPGAGGGQRHSGRGYTAKEVRIGIGYEVGLEDLADSVGVSGAAAGDRRRQHEMMIEYINDRGGLLGRRIVPVPFEFDANSPDEHSTHQAACSRWTEDTTVFLVVHSNTSYSNADAALAECLAKRGTPFVQASTHLRDHEVLRRYPSSYYVPGAMGVDRFAASYAEGLLAQPYFAPGAVVGLLRYEDAAVQRAVDTVLKPTLARAGVTIAEDVVVEPGDATQAQSAVLRLRSKGVDHLLILDKRASVSFLFLTHAASQDYYPKLAINTSMMPEFLRANLGERTFQGALGIGTMPTFDVAKPQDPLARPSTRLCRRIAVKAGLRPQDRLGEATILVACDAWLLVAAALAEAPDLSVEGLARGAESLGDRYAPPQQFATRMTPSRKDGTAAYRHLAWNDRCSCFEYRSRSHRAP